MLLSTVTLDTFRVGDVIVKHGTRLRIVSTHGSANLTPGHMWVKVLPLKDA